MSAEGDTYPDTRSEEEKADDEVTWKAILNLLKKRPELSFQTTHFSYEKKGKRIEKKVKNSEQ